MDGAAGAAVRAQVSVLVPASVHALASVHAQVGLALVLGPDTGTARAAAVIERHR